MRTSKYQISIRNHAIHQIKSTLRTTLHRQQQLISILHSFPYSNYQPIHVSLIFQQIQDQPISTFVPILRKSQLATLFQQAIHRYYQSYTLTQQLQQSLSNLYCQLSKYPKILDEFSLLTDDAMSVFILPSIQRYFLDYHGFYIVLQSIGNILCYRGQNSLLDCLERVHLLSIINIVLVNQIQQSDIINHCQKQIIWLLYVILRNQEKSGQDLYPQLVTNAKHYTMKAILNETDDMLFINDLYGIINLLFLADHQHKDIFDKINYFQILLSQIHLFLAYNYLKQINPILFLQFIVQQYDFVTFADFEYKYFDSWLSYIYMHPQNDNSYSLIKIIHQMLLNQTQVGRHHAIIHIQTIFKQTIFQDFIQIAQNNTHYQEFVEFMKENSQNPHNWQIDS